MGCAIEQCSDVPNQVKAKFYCKSMDFTDWNAAFIEQKIEGSIRSPGFDTRMLMRLDINQRFKNAGSTAIRKHVLPWM